MLRPAARPFSKKLLASFICVLTLSAHAAEVPTHSRFTEPKRKDGTVDYAEAFDRLARKGISREENAAVQLIKAMGHEFFNHSSSFKEVLLKNLKLEKLPDKGSYFMSLTDFVENGAPEEQLVPNGDGESKISAEAWDEFWKATARPWKEDEFPLVAHWLADSEGALKIITVGSTKKRWFMPGDQTPTSTVAGDLNWRLLPALSGIRQVSRALQARVGLKLGQMDADAAWRDIEVILRWSDLIAQEPIGISQFVASSMRATATDSILVIANDRKVSAKQLKRFAKAIHSWPRPPKLSRSFDIGQRMQSLELLDLLKTANGDLTDINAFLDVEIKITRIQSQLLQTSIDSKLAFERINQFYDQLSDAAKVATFPEFDKLHKKLKSQASKRLRRFSKQSENEWWENLAKQPEDQRVKKTTEFFADKVIGVSGHYLESLMRARFISKMKFQLARIALALAAFQRDNNAYPQTLAGLVPLYLKNVPNDLFNGLPLQYKRDRNGISLYSVGWNRKDDGGKEGDSGVLDLVVKMPK